MVSLSSFDNLNVHEVTSNSPMNRNKIFLIFIAKLFYSDHRTMDDASWSLCPMFRLYCVSSAALMATWAMMIRAIILSFG